MAIVFPAQIDDSTTLPSVVDGTSPISAQLINTYRSAILAIETTLGVNPGSTYSTVRARLDALEILINNQETIVLTGDLGGTLTNPKVVGIQVVSILATSPTAGQALIFNGSFWAPTTFVEQNQYILTLSGPPVFVEIGQVVMNPLFIATYSSTPVTATIHDNVGGPIQNIFAESSPFIPPNIFSYNQSYLSNSYTSPPYSVTFTLTSNNGSLNATTTLTIAWGQNIYYGLGSSGQSSQTFIKSLNGVGSDSKITTFIVDAGATDYIYFAYRSAYGAANFWVDGWQGGFSLVSNSISLTNHSGFTENYTLYQSNNSGLGNTTVNVL